MKNALVRYILSQLLLITAFLLASQALAQPPQHNVCFYDQPHFRGQSYCSTPGIDTPDASQIILGGYIYNWDKRIMSIQLIGAAKITVYNGINYTGTYLILDKIQPNLGNVHTTQGNYNWSNQISSYRTHW